MGVKAVCKYVDEIDPWHQSHQQFMRAFFCQYPFAK